MLISIIYSEEIIIVIRHFVSRNRIIGNYVAENRSRLRKYIKSAHKIYINYVYVKFD